jgi:glycosyltransferase involved in cell wall biosynthesis
MTIPIHTILQFVYALVLLISLGVSVYVSLKLRYAVTHFKMKKLISGPSMISDLPSVSVCIPARNETHAMTQCLEHVIASTYPKLEIIVMDDSSADNTSYLIKSFAHAGVRFVEGSSLPEGWLGKNHALQGLLDEASGTYILYMDVDTLIEPDTIEELVAYALEEKAAMISVLPRRIDGTRVSVLFSSLRYLWELILHSKKNPAVASGAWMVNRKLLKDSIGGLVPFATDIQPESKIAAALMETNQYRFIISTDEIGVNYEKKWRSQVDTSIRLLFPMFSKSFVNILIMVATLLSLVAPFEILIVNLVVHRSLGIVISSLIVVIITTLVYGTYLRKVWRNGWKLGMFLWPILVVQEAILLLISSYRYLTHRVTWKGRPVSVISLQ